MNHVTTTLAGCNFRPSEARAACKALEVGEALTLEADPFNKYDSNAIKVLTIDPHGEEGHFIGFVAKADNSTISAALLRGEELAAEVIAFESSIKPIIEITLP